MSATSPKSFNAFRPAQRSGQRGAALVVALVLLLVMTVLGVAGMRSTTLEERMAGNMRDANLAFQSAEAALRAGEQFLEGPLLPFTGTDGLLLEQPEAGRASFWNSWAWDTNSRTVTGIEGVAEDPQYVIEELPASVAADESLVETSSGIGDSGFYRITARAFGGTKDAVAILQTTYRRR